MLVKRLAWFFLSMLLLYGPAAEAARWRTNGQWFWGQSDGTLPANTTRCYALSGGHTLTGASVIGQRSAPLIAGTFSDLSLRVHVDSSYDIGGVNNHVTGTVMVNGEPSLLTSRIQGGAGFEREAPIPAESVTVADGDLVEFCITTGGVPVNSNQYHWSIFFNSAVPGLYVYPTVVSFASSGPSFIRALGSTAAAGGYSEIETQFLVPSAGAFTRALCAQVSPQVAGVRTWTLRKNGESTPLECNLQNGRTTSSDAVVPTVPGDLVSLRMAGSGASPSSSVMGITWVWAPEKRGEWWLASSGGRWGETLRFQRFLGPQSANSTRYSLNATPMASNVPIQPYVVLMRLHAAASVGEWSVRMGEFITPNSVGMPEIEEHTPCVLSPSSPTCIVTLAESADYDENGPHWYEFLVSPIGTPLSQNTHGKASVALRTLTGGNPVGPALTEEDVQYLNLLKDVDDFINNSSLWEMFNAERD